MNTTRLTELLGDGCTPLIRTDYTDDAAWARVVDAVTAPVNFGTDADADGDEFDPEGDDYTPYIASVEDPGFDGTTAATMGGAWSAGVIGYVLLADERSMTEPDDLTLVCVDLHDEPFGSGCRRRDRLD